MTSTVGEFLRSEPLTQSVIVRYTRIVIAMFKDSGASSRIGQVWAHRWDQLRQPPTRAAVWSRDAAVRRFGDRLAASIEQATITDLGQLLMRWALASWLYRWLTAEPEPDVIVIDLRETYALGPVLGLIKSITGMIAPFYPTATVRRLIVGVMTVASRVTDTWVGRRLVAVLEPPAPPETTAQKSSDTAESPDEP